MDLPPILAFIGETGMGADSGADSGVMHKNVQSCYACTRLGMQKLLEEISRYYWKAKTTTNNIISSWATASHLP